MICRCIGSVVVWRCGGGGLIRDVWWQVGADFLHVRPLRRVGGQGEVSMSSMEMAVAFFNVLTNMD